LSTTKPIFTGGLRTLPAASSALTDKVMGVLLYEFQLNG